MPYPARVPKRRPTKRQPPRSEADIQAGILRLSRGAVRLFRNQVGVYKLADGRTLRSGLCVGSSDLIGWRSVTIRPEDVGRTMAIFAAIEVKRPRKNPSEKQAKFLDAVRSAGGLAAVATSEEEVAGLLGLRQLSAGSSNEKGAVVAAPRLGPAPSEAMTAGCFKCSRTVPRGRRYVESSDTGVGPVMPC